MATEAYGASSRTSPAAGLGPGARRGQRSQPDHSRGAARCARSGRRARSFRACPRCGSGRADGRSRALCGQVDRGGVVAAAGCRLPCQYRARHCRRGPQVLEYAARDRNGAIQDYEARTAPVAGGGAITIVRRITERKRAERACGRASCAGSSPSRARGDGCGTGTWRAAKYFVHGDGTRCSATSPTARESNPGRNGSH